MVGPLRRQRATGSHRTGWGPEIRKRASIESLHHPGAWAMDTIDRSEAEGQRPSIPGVRQARRRRRPSGEPPPLPRTLGRSGGFWIVMIFGLVAFIAVLIAFQVGDPLERAENSFVQWIAGARTAWLTAVVRRANLLGSPIVPRVLGWGTILVLIAVRRWRHLVGFVGVTLVAAWLTSKLGELAIR